MEEDFSQMKATKVSKKDNLNKVINSVSSSLTNKEKPKTQNSQKKKSSTGNNTNKNHSTTNKTTSKSSTKKTSTSSNTTSTSSNSSEPVKRGRGRPRKNPLPENTNNQKNTTTQKVVIPVLTPASESSSNKTANKHTKKVKKSFKKQGLSLILLFLFLALGLFGGFLLSRYCLSALLFPNDTYEMVTYIQGDKFSNDIYIKQQIDTNDEFTYLSYTERGVKCIAFGKDISSQYTVKYYYRNDLTKDEIEVNEVDITKEGIYYAVYSVPSVKYKYVKLIRNIIVLRGEDDE